MSIDHDHMRLAVDWSLRNIGYVLGAVSAVGSAVAWVAVNTFSTNARVSKCKEDVEMNFKKALDEHEKREFQNEQRAHEAIREQIEVVHNHVIDVNHKIDSLTTLLLESSLSKRHG